MFTLASSKRNLSFLLRKSSVDNDEPTIMLFFPPFLKSILSFRVDTYVITFL